MPYRPRRAKRCLAIGCVSAALLVQNATGGASTYLASPDSYRQAVARLRPGDTLALSPGEYRNGLRVHNLSGTPRLPITITGPAGGSPAVFIAREGHNTVSIVDSGYVVIRNLVLEGGNLPVDGVKAEGHSRWAHHITLENLLIRGHGNNQQTVGISTKCPAWNWILRGNTIVGAGTGMYLGNSDGNAPFVAGLIERNLIVDSVGYNLQIKHQNPRPEMAGIPTARSMTIIRHNVFAKPEAGSQEQARPNVLVGHFPLEGPGAEDDYAIYGNFFFQNRYEALFQGEGNVALYSNLFVNEHGDAIRIQPHNDVPRRIVIAYNTVLAAGTGISVIQKEGSPQFRQVVAANAVFAGIPIATANPQAENVAAPLAEAGALLRRPFATLGQLDLIPRPGWPGAVSSARVPIEAFPDWGMDFSGRVRARGSVGAYSSDSADASWYPQLVLKPE